MPENDPARLSQPIEEALVRIIRPDLLEQYQREKERHREELRAIELARKKARQMIRRFFGNLRERKADELEQEYTGRVQAEADRHAKWLAELRETIRDYWRAETGDESG
ncbi:MAG: hypothetical protein L0Z62_29690, partial [Gemmataceae bacterium]|nr:hypothetical protein [Gemmataceae bacterium]